MIFETCRRRFFTVYVYIIVVAEEADAAEMRYIRHFSDTGWTDT